MQMNDIMRNNVLGCKAESQKKDTLSRNSLVIKLSAWIGFWKLNDML